jgi:hypothetical protein
VSYEKLLHCLLLLLQVNCCEHLDGDDNWQGCVLASNLYTCTAQFDGKPSICICCSES